MMDMAWIEVAEQNPVKGLNAFLTGVLDDPQIGGVLVPTRVAGHGAIMPFLVRDPAHLANADPLAPAFPLNAAGLLARLTRKASGSLIVAVLRPCEMRAARELVKLKQADLDEVILLSVDCPGAFPNRDFKALSLAHGPELTLQWLETGLMEPGIEIDGLLPAEACRACGHFLPEGADLAIGLWGVDIKTRLLIQAGTEKGADLLARLGLKAAEIPSGRDAAVANIAAARQQFRDSWLAGISEATSGIDKLAAFFSTCVNCYNCRVACPVCYCRECVFNTDVFAHEPFQYLSWADQKGMLKMPAETLFFHLTRLAHMSLSCVGCGQCANACPNQIPLAGLFALTGARTQAAFDYQAGRDVAEPPPLSGFKADEFQDIIGVKGS